MTGPDAGDQRSAYIDALIEGSSLGTPAARRLREQTSREHAAELVARAFPEIDDEVKAEALRLHAAWQQAHSRMKRTDASIDDQAESDAWDALIEFVEQHDLIYTEHDPRGPYGALYGENEGEGH